jgi:hypothetical protein
VSLPDQGIDHGFGILVRHLRQHHTARVALNQRGDLTVVRAEDQVAFPVTRYRTVFNRRWSLTDGHHILDLPPSVPFPAGMPRTAYRTLASQVMLQLLFQSPPGPG